MYLKHSQFDNTINNANVTIPCYLSYIIHRNEHRYYFSEDQVTTPAQAFKFKSRISSWFNMMEMRFVKIRAFDTCDG